MSDALPAEQRLAEIRARDAASAETWFKGPAGLPEGFGACGKAFTDRRWLLEYTDSLTTELAQWQGVAAVRNAELAEARQALSGIASCATCGVCREAAHKTLRSATQEAPRIAKCDTCGRVVDNSMAGQRCLASGARLCGGTFLTVL